MIDFHNHLIPGVDDGAADAAQALDGLRLMHEAGVTAVVCTPHVSGALTREPEALAVRLKALDVGWAELEGVDGPGVALHRGAEVMLDAPEPELSDPRLRLAGTRFVLVEFPFMNVPPNGAQALFDLKMKGWEPVLAHPERYANVRDDLADAAEWRRVGAHLQVNSGSLLGRYGDRAQKLAWGLVEHGWVDYLSSDYHARGRIHTPAAAAELDRRGAGEQLRLLTETNPARLLAGDPPLPVPPLARSASLWQRIFRRG